jgi:pyridoxamine 5'-phosphate oxidase
MDILHPDFTKTHPFDLFRQWLEAARSTEPADAEAMALATLSPEGMPGVRMVLLKELDEEGFCFYTNMESNKGRALAAHPVAALCWHWKSQQRQVRVEGDVTVLPPGRADRYFATRHPQSRRSAWASAQSRPVESRAVLEARIAEAAARFPGDDVPRPGYWQGYRVVPRMIEFWQADPYRLHDRFAFTRAEDGRWTAQRLNP